MTKTTRNIMRIDITPELQVGDIVGCEVDPQGASSGSKPKVKGGAISLRKDELYTLEFRLRPGECPDLEFETAGDDAFWCGTGTCPTAKGINPGGVFGTPRVSNGKTLEVDVESSPNSAIYFYRLNFTNGGNCDPIIIHD